MTEAQFNLHMTIVQVLATLTVAVAVTLLGLVRHERTRRSFLLMAALGLFLSFTFAAFGSLMGAMTRYATGQPALPNDGAVSLNFGMLMCTIQLVVILSPVYLWLASRPTRETSGEPPPPNDKQPPVS